MVRENVGYVVGLACLGVSSVAYGSAGQRTKARSLKGTGVGTDEDDPGHPRLKTCQPLLPASRPEPRGTGISDGSPMDPHRHHEVYQRRTSPVLSA